MNQAERKKGQKALWIYQYGGDERRSHHLQENPRNSKYPIYLLAYRLILVQESSLQFL